MSLESLSKKLSRWSLEHSIPAWGVFLILWEVLPRLLSFPSISASVVLTRVRLDLLDPGFRAALGGSLIRMAIGYAAAAFLGIGLGLLVGNARWLNNVLGTLAATLNAMPGAAWVPLAVFLFGLTQKAVIFTVILGATGIIMLNTSSGIQHVPPLILRAARTMGAKGTKMFWHVVFPSAIPRILDGLRLAWAFGWRALMAGELLIASVRGMGQLLNEVAKNRDLEQLVAFMVIIALIGVVVDGLIFNRWIGDRVRTRWGVA